MTLKIGNDPWQRASSLYVRMSVFVIERGIMLDDEFDRHDGEETVYAVVYNDEGHPVSTGRFIKETDEICRFTRIATLKEFRGQQLGSQVMKGLEKYAKEHNFQHVEIHAELTAVDFYTKHGYKKASDVYLEDDIPCQTLSKQL